MPHLWKPTFSGQRKINVDMHKSGQRIFPVGEAGASRIKVIFALMEHTQLLRAILPDVLIDNFDVVNFEKTASRFDIWLDEKKVQMREDKGRSSVISHGFGEYRTIRDFPIRGRSTYLQVRKRKWLDKDTGEIFSYDWELSEYDETHLNAEFVSFLKGGD